MNTHTDKALAALDQHEQTWLEFGRHAIVAILTENATLRNLSIRKWGTDNKEDRLGRYVMATRFHDSIPSSHPLYEEMKERCDYNDLATLFQIRKDCDPEYFSDTFEQFFIRDAQGVIVDTHSVDWLRGKLSAAKGGGGVDYLTKVRRYHKQIVRDLIQTPFDGLNTSEQLDAAADIRAAALMLDENLETLLALVVRDALEVEEVMR